MRITTKTRLMVAAVCAVAAALSGLVLLAASAGTAAAQRSEPLAHIACSPTATACQEQGNITTPADGTGVQATDVVPKGSTKGDIDIAPFSSDEVKTFDGLWYGVVDATPSLAAVKNVFVRRLLTCALIAPFVASFGTSVQVMDSVSASDPAELFAQLCVQTVYATYLAEPQPPAQAASGGCGMGLVSIPVEIKRSGRNYIAQINAKTRKASGRSPLVLSCRKSALSVHIGIRPRARRRKLHQVLGNHMTIGFANVASTPVKVHTTFAFR